VENFSNHKNKYDKVWVNVASSIYVVDDFINIDNHIFLSLMQSYNLVKYFIPNKYQEYLAKYYQTWRSHTLIKHDCRKQLPFEDSSVDHILCSHYLEHVYPEEMLKIIQDFHRILKPNATAHIIVPDLSVLVSAYLEKKMVGDSLASDEFIANTILSRENAGSVLFRFLEFVGGYGLQHRWMYDIDSISHKFTQSGFHLLSSNNSPSKDYRQDDGSVHIIVAKTQ
jgi:predicted SAM-dependent methyltransferase